jgi:glycosyltransferase involved in cell wall biosynthesis/2-polyprenyl-3-methyl-5-hydroxy-6-metoxy-1,4-benzoquinol methylase
MDELSVVYYGYVFDASGYGHAARAYIHALHDAGVGLSVVNLSGAGRQVQDPLIESLLGRGVDADFHLFHGIPPQWARLAFRLRNAIGMTVWETDTMPSQWRNVLNHTLEVWLPCDFNVSVFGRALEKPTFKVPHPVFPRAVDGNGDACSSESSRLLNVEAADFVFYSIFEWQERKSPQGLIHSFLRAFEEDKEPLLIIKTNPGAVQTAREALENARRQAPSDARVEIRSEAWDDAQIEALHARGDCYVSLHRGEGWGYPLFEAASRGKPVVATNYSGPLDYLDPREHLLVRCDPAPVHQPYLYYHPSMRWAEPDLNHAAELMRWVFENREQARCQAATAAQRIQQAYSVDAVGSLAKERLMKLLKHTQPQKWSRLVRERAAQLRPVVPIPGDWYDEDYFENGAKSNWDQGYQWPLFSSLFQETATFLTATYPEANSYLDIGCAKGFLVRALRDQGRECWGFDHSQWAIDRAGEPVRQFLRQVSVDDVSYDRQFDVLLAFAIFESLTEAQVRSFLARARSWTRQAIFAVIATFESAEEERTHRKDDRDLSRVTLRPRNWWHQAFLSAGWRQDYLHRVAQRACQNHELPSRMGWNVYVYAP